MKTALKIILLILFSPVLIIFFILVSIIWVIGTSNNYYPDSEAIRDQFNKFNYLNDEH